MFQCLALSCWNCFRMINMCGLFRGVSLWVDYVISKEANVIAS